MVEPTTAGETLQILRNIKDKYEDHHNVYYTDEALEACVKLTDRYITESVISPTRLLMLWTKQAHVYILRISMFQKK